MRALAHVPLQISFQEEKKKGKRKICGTLFSQMNSWKIFLLAGVSLNL